MKTVTSEGFHDLPTLRELDRRLTRQWDLGSDRQGAVLTSRLMLLRLKFRSAAVELAEDFWYISHGAEVLWDAKHIEDARQIAELWRQTVTLLCDREGLDPTEHRIRAAILSARVEHRARDFGAAVDYASFAITDARAFAGGEEVLRELLSLGVVSPATEMYCAALAIAIPAGRMRFGKVPALRAQFLDRWIADAQLMLGADAPPKLRRAHALVIQTFYAIAELDWSEERESWLERLGRFDDLVRPSDSRGQATKPLREVARASFRGDLEEAARHAEEARRSLNFLPRHMEALRLNRWWPLPPRRSS